MNWTAQVALPSQTFPEKRDRTGWRLSKVAPGKIKRAIGGVRDESKTKTSFIPDFLAGPRIHMSTALHERTFGVFLVGVWMVQKTGMWSWGVKKKEYADVVGTTLCLSRLTLKVHYSDPHWAASVSLRWPVGGGWKLNRFGKVMTLIALRSSLFSRAISKYRKWSNPHYIHIPFTAHSVTSSPWATSVCSWVWS